LDGAQVALGNMGGVETRSIRGTSMKISRRIVLGVVGLISLAIGATTVSAQDSAYVFAGAFNDNQVYVSDRVRSVPTDPQRNSSAERELKEAFVRSIRQQTGSEAYRISGQHLGPAGRHGDADAAEDARLNAIEQWRRQGRPVTVIRW
jgi:hypothetical protein